MRGLWRGVGRRVLACAAALTVLTGLLAGGRSAGATVSPDYLEVTLRPGESLHEVKTVEVPRSIPKADILFSFDLTGSMGGVLNTAKAQAISIMNDLDSLISDAHYGVISYMDYTQCYNSYGYYACYGDSAHDYPYSLDLSPSADRTQVSDTINGLVLGFGNDSPEDYTRPLYESYADPNVHWRHGARRILINFGDSVPHDDDLNEGTGLSGTWSTGGDPGRDEVMFTGDDLDLQTVIQGMADNGVILFAVQSGGAHMEPYWRTWAEATGGRAVPLDRASSLAAVIRDVIESSAARVGNLRLVVTPGFESWVNVSPAAHTDVVTPDTRTFDVAIIVPMDTPPGDYSFTVEAIGDGASYGVQRVLVHVLALDENPPVTALSLSGAAGQAGWWRSDVEGSLSATDDISGVKETRYCVDGSPMSLYGGPFMLSGDGLHTVCYRSEDNVGNVEPLHNGEVRIDTAAPDVSGALSGPLGDNGWYMGDVTFRMSAADATSGLAGSFFDIYLAADGPDGFDAYAGPAATSAEGVYQVDFYAADVAGNESEQQSLSFMVDTMPPEITVAPLAAEYGNSDTVHIEYSATDSISGVASVAATLNGAPVESGTDLTLAPGHYELVVTARDMAGHESMTTAAFRVCLGDTTVRFEPEVLEKNRGPRWVSVFVRFPAGADVRTIRCETVLLNGVVPAVCDHGSEGHGGGRQRMFKFSRDAVEAIAPDAAAQWTVTVTGEYGVGGGLCFRGQDVIRVQDHHDGDDRDDDDRDDDDRDDDDRDDHDRDDHDRDDDDRDDDDRHDGDRHHGNRRP